MEQFYWGPSPVFDPKDPQTSNQIGLAKTDYTPYLKTDATIKTIDDDYNFINQYVADNPSATGPFKYGYVRIDSSHLIDLSTTSADTLKYLSDRALDLKNSQTLGIDKFLAEKGLAAIVYSGTAGAGIGAKEGYPTVIVQAGYQTLNNLNPLGISCLGKAYQEDKLLGYAYTY